jgi:hypothetical protein
LKTSVAIWGTALHHLLRRVWREDIEERERLHTNYHGARRIRNVLNALWTC